MSKVLHLRFDKIDNNQVTDRSGNDLHGTIHGDLKVVNDDKFGSVMEFNGTNAYVSLYSPEQLKMKEHSFTACAWINFGDGGHFDQSVFCNFSQQTDHALHLIIRHKKLYTGFYFNDSTHPQPLSANQWYFVTWAYDAATREQISSVDGVIHTSGNHRPFKGTVPVDIGRWVGNRFYKGKLYGIRIYDTVLSQAEIQAIIHEDNNRVSYHSSDPKKVTMVLVEETTNSKIEGPSFRAAHPIDFDLQNQDQQSFLPIGKTDVGTMSLRIKNASTQRIALKKVDGAVGPDNHHFVLRFRPDVLKDQASMGNKLIDLHEKTKVNWEMSALEKDGSGMHVLYIKSKLANGALSPQKEVVMVLENMVPDSSLGPRGTRIELKTKNLYHEGHANDIETHREKHLWLLKHHESEATPPPPPSIPSNFSETITFSNGTRFSGDRHWFQDSEIAGRIRVGGAWGIPGLYSEDSKDLVLGVDRNRTVQIGCHGKFLKVGGDGNVGIGGNKYSDSKLAVESNLASTIYAKNYGSGNAISVTGLHEATIWAENTGNENAIYGENSSNYYPTIYAKNHGSGGYIGGETADYAEYFESISGEAIAEGTTVILENGKIRPAKEGEAPIGVISSSPMVVGNLPNEWPGKFVMDDLGRKVLDEVKEEIMVPKMKTVAEKQQKFLPKRVTETISKVEIVQNEKGQYIQRTVTEEVEREVLEPEFEEVELYNEAGEKIGKHKIPVMETTSYEVPEKDDTGNPVMFGSGEFTTTLKPRIHPDYNPEKEYESRAKRPEWNCVGLLGQLPVLKGQVAGERWTRMRELSEIADLWLVR